MSALQARCSVSAGPRTVAAPVRLAARGLPPLPRRRHALAASALSANEESAATSGPATDALPSPVPVPASFGAGSASTRMARGSFGGGGATLQRARLNLLQKSRIVEPKLDFSGGGGGIGKNIHNGGGGGGGDDDDDDYFGSFDDGEGGGGGDGGRDPWWRAVIKQLYDESSLNAVLSEWGRAAADLPAILRQSVALGLFSSAQLVRFLAMDVRPGAVRSLTRALPPRAARGLVGRLMADPAFAHKLAFEVGLTALWSLAWEAAARGDAFWGELDFVALNTAALALAGAAGVWAAAPTRAAAIAGGGGPWAAALAGVPNHAFDASTPARAYGAGARAAALAARGVELALVGGAAGAVMAGGGRALTALHARARGEPGFAPAAPVPSLASAAAMAATGGLVSNLRLQLLGGVDRVLFEHAGSLASYFAPALTLRAAASWAAHETRLEAQGLGRVLPARRAAAAAAAEAAEAAAAARRRPKAAAAAGPPRRKRLVRKVGAGAPPGAASHVTAALHPGSAGEAAAAAAASTSLDAAGAPAAAAAAGAAGAAGAVAAEGGLPPPRGPRKAAVPTGKEAAEGVAGPPRRRRKKKAPAGFSISASA